MSYAERSRSQGDTFPQQNSLPTRETAAVPGTLFDLPTIIGDIQASADAPTHEERTRELLRTPDLVMIVSGYQPGEGEDLHKHPTRNIIQVLAGSCYFWVVNAAGTLEQHDLELGNLIALEREQAHCIQAKEAGVIVMVSIIEGMPTDTPGYSVPATFP